MSRTRTCICTLFCIHICFNPLSCVQQVSVIAREIKRRSAIGCPFPKTVTISVLISRSTWWLMFQGPVAAKLCAWLKHFVLSFFLPFLWRTDQLNGSAKAARTPWTNVRNKDKAGRNLYASSHPCTQMVTCTVFGAWMLANGKWQRQGSTANCLGLGTVLLLTFGQRSHGLLVRWQLGIIHRMKQSPFLPICVCFISYSCMPLGSHQGSDYT